MDAASNNRLSLPSRPAHPNRPGRIPISDMGLDTSGSPFGLPDLPLPFRRTRSQSPSPGWLGRRGQTYICNRAADSSVSSDEELPPRPTYEDELAAELRRRAFRPPPLRRRGGPAGIPLSPHTRDALADHRQLARTGVERFFANFAALNGNRPIQPVPPPAPAAAAAPPSPPSLRDSTQPAVDSRSSRPSSLPVTPARGPSADHDSSSLPDTPPGSLERREPVVDRLASQFSQLEATGPTPPWSLPRGAEHLIRPLSPRRQEASDARRTRIEQQSRLLFFAALSVKEHRPDGNADQLWLDFVAKLVDLGLYSDEEEIRSAWHFVFREAPRPLFAYFVTGSFQRCVEKVNNLGLFI